MLVTVVTQEPMLELPGFIALLIGVIMGILHYATHGIGVGETTVYVFQSVFDGHVSFSH
jgi:hypothetical protein